MACSKCISEDATTVASNPSTIAFIHCGSTITKEKDDYINRILPYRRFSSMRKVVPRPTSEYFT